jgi:hypothetical protein
MHVEVAMALERFVKGRRGSCLDLQVLVRDVPGIDREAPVDRAVGDHRVFADRRTLEGPGDDVGRAAGTREIVQRRRADVGGIIRAFVARHLPERIRADAATARGGLLRRAAEADRSRGGRPPGIARRQRRSRRHSRTGGVRAMQHVGLETALDAAQRVRLGAQSRIAERAARRLRRRHRRRIDVGTAGIDRAVHLPDTDHARVGLADSRDEAQVAVEAALGRRRSECALAICSSISKRLVLPGIM